MTIQFYLFFVAFLGWAKVKGFQTLSKKLMIYGPKDPPPKFQPSIRSKSARIKTRAEREHNVNHSHCTSQLKFWWWVFGAMNHQFFVKGLTSFDSFLKINAFYGRSKMYKIKRIRDVCNLSWKSNRAIEHPESALFYTF